MIIVPVLGVRYPEADGGRRTEADVYLRMFALEELTP